MIGASKGDTRSLDYGSYVRRSDFMRVGNFPGRGDLTTPLLIQG